MLEAEKIDVHVGMKVEVLGDIGDGEVVAGQLRLGHVKWHLITGEPAKVATNGRSMHSGSTVQVNIGVDGSRFMLEFALDDTRLLAKANGTNEYINSFLSGN